MAKWLLKYNYPQIVFGKEITSYLLNTGKSCKTIIDCPCGNGETAWHLSRIGGKVIAADISEDSIKNALQNFDSKNISYSVQNINAILGSETGFNVFCLVNSLFLLSDYDAILKNLYHKITLNKAVAVIIIPNTEGNNFKWFQSQNTNENKLVLKESEIESFFNGYGFKTELIKPICYTHHYNRKDVKLFSVFWSLYLSFLNNIQTIFKIGKANYFLIALTPKST